MKNYIAFPKLFPILLFLLFTSAISFAQSTWYVNWDTGNNFTKPGTEAEPFETIEKALSVGANGDIIIIAGGLYNESEIDLDLDVTLEITEYGGSSTVILVNGFDLKADILFKNGVFQTKYTTLTSGILSSDLSDLLMPNGSLLEIFQGTLQFEPVYEGLSTIQYSLTDDHIAGNEIPASSDDFKFIINDNGNNHSLTTNAGFMCNDVNVISGTLILGGDAVFTGDLDNNDVIDVDDYTLTFNPDNDISLDIGTVISGSGEGFVTVAGNNNILANNGGTLPNFNIPADYSGTFSFNDDFLIDGEFNLNCGVVPSIISTGSDTFEITGDFNRNNSTNGNFNVTTNNAIVKFSGNADSYVNPGENFTFHEIEIDKNGATLILGNYFTVADNAVITSGTIDLLNHNIIMTGSGAVFENHGDIFSSTGLGRLSFQNVGSAVPIATIQGSGVFGDMELNMESSALKLYTGSATVECSGTIIVDKGKFEIQAGHTLKLTNDFVDNPTIKINSTQGNTGLFVKDPAGTLAYNADVSLWYYGSGNYTAGDEWEVNPTRLFDLHADLNAGLTLTGYAGESVFSGELIIESNVTLNPSANVLYTLDGNDKIHTITGRISDGLLNITGKGVSLNGAQSSAEFASVNDLRINVLNDGTFESTNLQIIKNLTFANGIAAFSLNNTAAEITENLNVINGAITFDQGAGSITKDMTVSGGKLILGNDLNVEDDFVHEGDGIVDLNGYDLYLADDYTHDDNASFAPKVLGSIMDNMTGRVIANDPGNWMLTTDVSIPILEIDHAGKTTLNNGDLTIVDAFYFSNGTFDLNGNDLFIDGSIFEFNLETPAVFDASGSASTLHLTGNDLVITPIDLGTPPFNNDPIFSTVNNNLNVTINSTGKITFGTDGVDDYTYEIDGLFSQLKGDVEIGENQILLTGGFNRTEGDWIQGTAAKDGMGFLKMQFNGNFSSGDNWSIENLIVQPGAGKNIVNIDNVPYTVNKVLWLADGSINQNSDGNLTLGDDGWIWRQDGVIDDPLTFGSRANVWYLNPTSNYLTGEEWPDTPALIQRAIIETPGQIVTLSGDRQINKTFGLYDGTFDIDDNALTLNDDSAWELKAAAVLDVTDNDADIVANKYHLWYLDGAVTTNDHGEFPDDSDNILSLNVEDATMLTLDGDKTVYGPMNIDVTSGNGIDFDDYTISAKGDVTVNRNCFFNSGIDTGRLTFSGDSRQSLNVPAASLTFPVVGDDAAIRINNTSDEGVILTGGNLIMDNTSRNHLSIIDFVQGTFNTGDNYILMWHTDDGIEPVQGFTRNVAAGGYSHVVGSVRKFIDATGFYTPNYPAIALARVEFPLGSAPSSPGYYRPLAIKYNTLPSTGFFLTVSHTDEDPEGYEGLPVAALDAYDIPFNISKYQPFYWTLSPTITLQPQVAFDLEFTIEGYDAYLTEDIENIRMIKREDDDNTEDWELADGAEYDNEIENNLPVILIRNAEEALVNPAQRFVVGIKSKLSSGSIDDVIVGLPGNAWSYDLTNLNVTGNSGDLTYTVTSSNTGAATASISDDVLTVTPVEHGSSLIEVKATDIDDDFIISSFTFTYDTNVDVYDEDVLPNDFSLSQNYPNPFNPSTTIRFGLPNEGNVRINVFNMLGQKVASLVNGFLSAGYHEITFDAAELTSGLYVYKLEAGEFTSVKKMILLK